MKSIQYITLLVLLVASVGVGTVRAETTSTTTKTTATSKLSATDIAAKKKAADDALAAYKAAKASDKLVKLQALGDTLIDHRVASLNQFVTTVSAKKDLSTAQVTTLKTSATATIDALSTLKTKIDADSTVDSAKTDVKSIFDTYHVYAVMLPQLHLTVALDEGQALLDKLNALTARVQKAIDTKTAAGVDATALTTALTDYKAQLADAAKQLTACKAEIAKIVITSTETSKTPIINARDDLKSFRADLVAARGDLATIKDGLTVATTSVAPTTSTQSTTGTSTTTSNNASSSTKTPAQ